MSTQGEVNDSNKKKRNADNDHYHNDQDIKKRRKCLTSWLCPFMPGSREVSSVIIDDDNDDVQCEECQRLMSEQH